MFDAPTIYDEVDRLGEELRVGAANLAAAEYRWLRLFAEFDELGGWAKQGCRSPAQWMSWACGIGPEAARERVRVAQALPDLLLVCEAFSRGELSYSKVRAITRIATPETEALLVEWGRHATAAQLEKIVRGVRRMRRIEEAREDQARYAGRYLQWYRDEDGMLVIRGRLPAEDGRVVVEALERVAKELAAEASGERDETTTPTRFRGIGELSELAAYSTEAPNLWPARKADALRLMAETTLEHGTSASSRPPELVVHVDAGLLTEDGDGDTCHLEGAPEIPAETARRLGCDASARILIRGPDGTPLDVGRATRTISPALRRALVARDRHCVFPGCAHTIRCQAHHVRAWADGGDTAMGNLALLCPFHHRLVHEGGYRCLHDGGGRLRFLRPDGTEVPAVPPPLRGDPDRPGAENRALALEIDADTIVTKEYQPRPDYSVAVGVLLDELEGTALP